MKVLLYKRENIEWKGRNLNHNKLKIRLAFFFNFLCRKFYWRQCCTILFWNYFDLFPLKLMVNLNSFGHKLNFKFISRKFKLPLFFSFQDWTKLLNLPTTIFPEMWFSNHDLQLLLKLAKQGSFFPSKKSLGNFAIFHEWKIWKQMHDTYKRSHFWKFMATGLLTVNKYKMAKRNVSLVKSFHNFLKTIFFFIQFIPGTLTMINKRFELNFLFLEMQNAMCAFVNIQNIAIKF